jgi:hypothetical protein
VNTDPDATAVATTRAARFGPIDNQDYQGAWDTCTSGEQATVLIDTVTPPGGTGHTAC